MELDFGIIFTNTSVEERLAESTAKIALYNFEWRFTTFVFFNTTLLCGEEVFAKIYNKSMVVCQNECDLPNAQSVQQHVLFGTDIKNIELILHWMQKHVFDNTGKHIIVCLSENKVECSEFQANRIFWNYKVTNVVFIRRAFNDRGIVGYTYHPLEDSLCDIGPPVKLNNLDACTDVPSKNNCKMFPRKLRNLHGCPLIVSTIELPPYTYMNKSNAGVVGDTIRLLEERLSATFKIMTPRKPNGFGVLQPDGTWDGSLGDVYHDLANFSYAALTLQRFESFDMTISHNFVHFVWVIRPTQFESSSLKLLRPFCMDTHIAVATSYAFVIASALLTKTKLWTELSTSTGGNKNRSRSSVIFYSWMLFLGLPTNKLPKKRTLLVIVYIWIWYTFLIRTIYQASLINSLKHNIHLPNHDTIEAAINADFQFGGSATLKEYYIDSPTIYNNWTDLDANMFDKTLEKISEGHKFVEAHNFDSVKLFLLKFKNRKIHILPQIIGVSPTAMYFKKFSPLVTTINHILERLIETGFTNKFYEDYTKVPLYKAHETKEPLTLEHFKGCYIILFTGWIVSFVLFICEIVFVKWLKKRFLFR